jgi:putative endonuclease
MREPQRVKFETGAGGQRSRGRPETLVGETTRPGARQDRHALPKSPAPTQREKSLSRGVLIGFADQLEYTGAMTTGVNLWQVYIVRCADATLYTGIARDVVRRVNEHNHSRLAARYTRGRRPVVLVYAEACDSRSQALRRETAIKKLSRRDKERLCTPPSAKG